MQVLQVFQLGTQASVLLIESFLLTTLSVHLNVHHADIVCESRHHAIILAYLLFHTAIGTIHVRESVVKFGYSMLHLSNLIPLFAIF